jgi:hypothetical protein
MQAFATAGDRLKACLSATGFSSGVPSATQQLSTEWTEMKPRLVPRALHANPDMVDNAMDLVFRIERETSDTCGSPKGPDLALLLLAKQYEGN